MELFAWAGDRSSLSLVDHLNRLMLNWSVQLLIRSPWSWKILEDQLQSLAGNARRTAVGANSLTGKMKARAKMYKIHQLHWKEQEVCRPSWVGEGKYLSSPPSTRLLLCVWCCLSWTGHGLPRPKTLQTMCRPTKSSRCEQNYHTWNYQQPWREGSNFISRCPCCRVFQSERPHEAAGKNKVKVKLAGDNVSMTKNLPFELMSFSLFDWGKSCLSPLRVSILAVVVGQEEFETLRDVMKEVFAKVNALLQGQSITIQWLCNVQCRVFPMWRYKIQAESARFAGCNSKVCLPAVHCCNGWVVLTISTTRHHMFTVSTDNTRKGKCVHHY